MQKGWVGVYYESYSRLQHMNTAESSLCVLLNKVRFTTDYIPLMDLPLLLHNVAKDHLDKVSY